MDKSKIQRLKAAIDRYESEPRKNGFDLRDDLSVIIVEQCAKHNWTQKELAKKAGMRESYISRLIHSNANCTFDVAGRVLHALGLDATLKTKMKTTLAASVAPTIEDDVYERTKETGTDRRRIGKRFDEEGSERPSHYAKPGSQALVGRFYASPGLC